MNNIQIQDLCYPVKSIKKDFFRTTDSFEYIDISSINRISKKIESITTTLSSEAPSRAKQLVTADDVLVSTVRPNLNSVAIVEDKHKGSIASSGFCVLRPNKEKLDSLYLSYFVRTKGFISYLVKLSTGANYPAVSDKIVKSCKIPLPPLETQKQIVALLDRAQALIDKRKEQIDLMDQLTQSLFYDMFGDPVTNPMGWDVDKLNGIVSIKHGYAFKSEYFSEIGEYVLLTPGNFYEHGGYRDRGDKQKYYTGDIPNDYILKQGQMLLAMTEQAPGLLGSPIIVPKSDKYLHNQRLGLVVPLIEELNFTFLFYFFNTPYFRKKLNFTSTGTKVKHTSPNKISEVETPLPPIDLQNTFAERVQEIEAQKAAMTESLGELEDNFQSMMQRAFKGELIQ